MTRQEGLAVGAGALCGILVGAAMVASRFALQETSPASLALFRYAIGGIGLAPALFFVTIVPFRRRDLLPVAALGIGQFGILIALLNYGLQFVGSGMAALLFSTMPVMTMLFAALGGLEKATWPKLTGIALSILGVGIAVGAWDDITGQGHLPVAGLLCVLASAATGGLCSIFYRPYLQRYPPVQVGLLAMAASVLFLAVPAAWEGVFATPPSFSPAGWAAVIFIGLSSSLGYAAWLFALKYATPTRVALFMALGPVVATGLGAVWLGEPVTYWFLLALIAVIAGLWAAHRPENA